MNNKATVYISLGSNLGDRKGHLENAVALLQKIDSIEVKNISSVVETKPLGMAGSPDFLNLVVQIQTSIEPFKLLEELHKIEDLLGRKRNMSGRWSDRTIDLDLLMYDNLVIDSPHLKLPHPDMHLRSFVLKGMAEISPDLIHPRIGVNMLELSERLNGCDFLRVAGKAKLICFSGVLGSGKTTAAGSLADIRGWQAIREAYDTNPFMPDVYAGKQELALDSQIHFLITRFEQIGKEHLKADSVYVADYVFDKDVVYARKWLDDRQFTLYEKLYKMLCDKVAEPDIVVRLDMPINICLERIHKRNRPYEQNIKPDFLEWFDRQYRQMFAEWKKSPVIKIKDEDFDARNPADIEKLAAQIDFYV